MPRFVTLITLALLAVLLTQGGCLSAASRKRASDSGSIFAAFGPPTPAEAAAMMADPFDADKRYKGVTWISNAPWGGADVYLRVYRELIANEKEDPGVRAVAARALAMHGSVEDALLIAPLLKSDDKRVRQTATRALQRLHNPAVIPDLVLCVDTNDRVVIRVITTNTDVEAANARARIVNPTAPVDAQVFAAVAREVSRDPYAANGGLVPGEVGSFFTGIPGPLRMAIMRTPVGTVSPVTAIGDAAAALGGGRFAFAMVEKRSPGELDRDVRSAAASALGQYPDKRALDALIFALNDDELSVSRTARQSLRTLTGHDEGDEPKNWQTWSAAQSEPFAGQTKYLYPNFERGKYFWEYIPLVPPPPNEPASTPIGYRPPGT